MSYLVLARKWRPKRFAELVGQEHVVRALTNALDSGRVHHAFLFTGTRGVGKTTIARIFAKSLNCERGTSADPCGECNSCRDIDAGRFIDLLEIDAASNTGVDDVRDVIDNAQYMPSRGRVKVYLIDEVHMLSKSAFNALLKTLEEPPGHVKFLLATTDPQKLPVTVLSRCLQFNLKRLEEEQIRGQMRKILGAEGIAVEDGAVKQLARAADGSLRDGLSLLDQAIAYTGSRLTDEGVAAMLGTVDRGRVGALLDALSSADGAALMAEIEHLGEFSPDWDDVLEALAEALHHVQIRQLVPGAAIEVDGVAVDALADALPPEVVQLWYQMALNGRRDLPLAPSPRAGFEMVLLRMLAFRPTASGATPAGGSRPDRAAAPARGTGDAAAAARAALQISPETRARNDAEIPSSSAAIARSNVVARASHESSNESPGNALRLGETTSRRSADTAAVHKSETVEVTPRSVAAPSPGFASDATSESESVAASALSGASEMAGVAASTASATANASTPSSASMPSGAWTSSSASAPFDASTETTPVAAPVAEPNPGFQRAAIATHPSDGGLSNELAWRDWVETCDLRGPARLLAEHVGFIASRDGVLTLSVEPSDEHLKGASMVKMLADALAPRFGQLPQIRFESPARPVDSVRVHVERARDAKQAAAQQDFERHPDVQRLVAAGGRIVADSVRPLER